ncbi:hypothetical protein BsWGS_11326 [Bradybaena similaris]
MMPILTEVVSDISQLTHTSGEDEKILVFKSEPSMCSEMGGLEMDHFEAVTEVEMGSVSMIKTEEVDGDGSTHDDAVSVPFQQIAPQQFIILTRTSDGSSESVELSEGVHSKFIRFDGADGQTYVLAVADDVAEVITEPVKSMTQQLAPVKSLKGGRKRPAGTSATTVGTPSATPSRAKTSHSASVDGINQAWFTTKDDKNALHNEGHKWKQGQWTKEEVEVLEANINKYCKDNSIKDPAEVIFEMSKDERKDFYRTVALGIQRPLFSVYRRVTRMYDRKNHRGKYTPNEMKCLRILRAKHGNDWAVIGGALGRSASSVKDKCRLMKDNCNSGKWYPEEEARLAAAVYELTGVKPSESVTSGLSWASVAEHVGTRSEKQCRTKWLNYLNWKQQGGADWTREDDTILIEKVSKMDVNNDSEIDWVSLSQDWASVRSPQWLRGKWWALKRHITDYNKLSYKELLDQMKRLIYWNLKPKMGLRQPKDDGVSAGLSSELFKGCIPVSLTTGVDGSTSLSLSYCPSDDEGFQAFEVLQQWTPQIIGSVSQGVSTGEGTQSILSTDGGHIIVQTLAPSLGDGIQLNGQQQVIISAGDISNEEETSEGLTVHVGDGLVQSDQDLSVLSSGDTLHDSSTFSAGSEEIVTVAEFHTQSDAGDTDILGHDVFETGTSESGGDLVMGVSSPTHASSLMTSLKDPIMMSSSDVECEKSQSAVLTDESSDIID